MNLSRRLQNLLRVVMPPLLALLIVVALAYVHVRRHYHAELLSNDAFDTLQAARYFARTGQFGTLVVRPLISGFTPFRGDGSQPDLGHSPLYTILASLAMRLMKQTTAGSGDTPVVILTVLLWAGSIISVFLLTRRLFATNFVAMLSCFLYAFASGLGLSWSITPHPATLAALIFPLLFLSLALLDRKQDEPPISIRATIFWSVFAGIFYGLLFLSVYSTLILLPVFVWHLWRVTGKSRWFASIPVFLILFTVLILPYLWRNYMQTRNPLYNSRGMELIMHTETYPGYELYRSAILGQSLGQFLSSGGYSQVVNKAYRNIVGYTEQLPSTFGLVLFPLYIGAGLIRFDDARTNRLRMLAYLCLGIQFVGLSLYQPVAENVPLLLMHQALGAVFATGFLITVIRARNLTRFYENFAIWGWMGIGCLPGLILYIVDGSGRLPEPWTIYISANNEAKAVSKQMEPMRAGKAFLVSEAPAQWAFRCEVPTIWIPKDAGDFHAVEDRAKLPIGAVVLTPDIVSQYQSDTAAQPWQTTYLRLGSVWSVAASLDPQLRQKLRGKIKLYYPVEISPALSTFVPEPFEERDGRQYTILFWNPKIVKLPIY